MGIKAIFNLQCPGEHAHCGDALAPSGFSYTPEAFMASNSTWMMGIISSYNILSRCVQLLLVRRHLPWAPPNTHLNAWYRLDFGVPTIDSLNDMVKVMDWVIESGGKVAVHCHAGLGPDAPALLFMLTCTFRADWVADSVISGVLSATHR